MGGVGGCAGFRAAASGCGCGLGAAGRGCAWGCFGADAAAAALAGGGTGCTASGGGNSAGWGGGAATGDEIGAVCTAGAGAEITGFSKTTNSRTCLPWRVFTSIRKSR